MSVLAGIPGGVGGRQVKQEHRLGEVGASPQSS